MSTNYPEHTGFKSNAMFDWIDDMPKPRINKTYQREQVQALYHAAGALPYRGVWNPDTQRYEMDDPRFEGATIAEVAVMRDWDEAALPEGSKARERVMDRILGKPKQAVESVSMNMSYTDFLEESAKQAAYEGVHSNPVEYVQYTTYQTDDEYGTDYEDVTRGI